MKLKSTIFVPQASYVEMVRVHACLSLLYATIVTNVQIALMSRGVVETVSVFCFFLCIFELIGEYNGESPTSDKYRILLISAFLYTFQSPHEIVNSRIGRLSADDW